MRNTILFLLFSLIIPSAFATVQGQVFSEFHTRQVSMSATANVIDNLVLTTMRDVNLNSPSVVDGQVIVPPVTSQYAGLMRITGSPGKLVRITYLANETLIEQNGSGGVVKATYRISGFESDNQIASVLLDVGEATVRLGKDGNYFIWLGAVIDLSKATPGSYVSEFIIELESN